MEGLCRTRAAHTHGEERARAPRGIRGGCVLARDGVANAGRAVARVRDATRRGGRCQPAPRGPP